MANTRGRASVSRPAQVLEEQSERRQDGQRHHQENQPDFGANQVAVEAGAEASGATKFLYQNNNNNNNNNNNKRIIVPIKK